MEMIQNDNYMYKRRISLFGIVYIPMDLRSLFCVENENPVYLSLDESEITVSAQNNSTAKVSWVDNLGRIQIPKSLRKAAGIQGESWVVMYPGEDSIRLARSEPQIKRSFSFFDLTFGAKLWARHRISLYKYKKRH